MCHKQGLSLAFSYYFYQIIPDTDGCFTVGGRQKLG